MKIAAAVLGAIVLWLLALADLAGQVPGNTDDAFIVLVYARHFAQGGGFYYNAGDGPLDGFSSLLDVLLKGLALRLWPTDGVRVNFWVSLVAYLAAVSTALLLARRIFSGRPGRAWLAAPAALALALTPGLAEGTSYLLETPLLAFLLFGALTAFAGERPLLAPLALFALGLVLVRPEATPIALFLLGATLAARPRGERALAAGTLAAVAAFALAFHAWRAWTFGSWAPNSYHAKTSAQRLNEVRDGLHYVLAAARTRPGVAPLAFVLCAPLFARNRSWSSARARSRFAQLSAAALLALGVVVVSGGDCYPGARFLLLPLAIGGSALLFALAHLSGRAGTLLGAWLGLTLLGGLARVLPDLWPKLAALAQAAPGDADFACSRDVSARLAQVQPGARLGQVHFQRFKYFQDAVHVFDLTGINQREVAHLPIEDPVAFGKPGLALALAAGIEILHLDYRWSHPLPMARHGTAELLASPELRETFALLVEAGCVSALVEHYTPASLAGACSGQYVNVFVRRELAPAFAAAGFLVGPP